MVTWEEFKNEMKKAGVKDETVIEYIDIDCSLQELKIKVIDGSVTVFSET